MNVNNMRNVMMRNAGPASTLAKLAVIGGNRLYGAISSLYNAGGGHRAFVSHPVVGKKDMRNPLAGLSPAVTQGLRWRVFDAKGEVLGRLSSRIAVVLMGKDKPTYTPNQDNGDICVVLNAKDITLTGNKLTDKKYYWHTGYIGHVKERTVKEQMVRDSTEVIRKAVLRMLPRNKLRDDRMLKLRIFPDDNHPFADKPLDNFVMPPRKVREIRPRDRRAALRSQQGSSRES